MRAVRDQISCFAPNDLPVLVRGPTGTGKELVAMSLHASSRRRDGPFVAINCATLSTELAESQLFGHVRGAFTGAHFDHAGAFVRASGGTLFLDEIGELPLPQQAKLLRALESRSVLAVGAEREVEIDARVVAATHRDLERMVADGRFREDLFHRLCVLAIHLPALSARREDIPELLEHLAKVAARELGRPVRLRADAIEAATRQHWPGNVRELKNAVLRAAATHRGAIGPEALTPFHLPAPHKLSRVPGHSSSARDVVSIPRGDYRSMKMSLLLHEVERHGSINRAATALGIPRSTLSSWLRRLKSAG
jgi:DNA-binding NtrC family response regulator